MLNLRRRLMLGAEREQILYDSGDQCSAVTGGWVQVSRNTNKGTLSFYDDSLRMFNSPTVDYVNNRATTAITNNKIPLRGFKKLCLTYHVEQRTTESAIYIAIYPSHSGGLRTYVKSISAKVSASTSGSTRDRRTLELDISGYPDDYYVSVLWVTEPDTSESHIAYAHKVWLE